MMGLVDYIGSAVQLLWSVQSKCRLVGMLGSIANICANGMEVDNLGPVRADSENAGRKLSIVSCVIQKLGIVWDSWSNLVPPQGGLCHWYPQKSLGL